MHLVGPYLTTSRYNHKKKKSAKQLKADAEHEAWLKKRGLDRDRVKAVVDRTNPRAEMPKYEYQKVEYSNVVGSGMQSGVMANFHKEAPHVQKAILDKAKRTAPAYSKGPYQYITPGVDLSDIGKKK